MTWSSRRALIFTTLASTSALCIALCIAPAWAQQPELVERTFAFVAAPGTVVDFTADNSQLVVVSKRSINDQLHFAADAGDEDLNGTVWAFQDAVHVTNGSEAPEGSFVWLLDESTPDVPPKGAMTKTGPESLRIVSQKIYSIKLCGTSGCGVGESTSYQINPYGSGGDVFVVVTALFQK